MEAGTDETEGTDGATTEVDAEKTAEKPSEESSAAGVPDTPDPKPTPTTRTQKRAEKRAAKQSAKQSDSSSTRRSARAASKAAKAAAKTDQTGSAAPSELGEQGTGIFHAAHPRQALATAVAVGAGAVAAGRPVREVTIAALAVLLVQVALGLFNDAGDEQTDRATGTPAKPVAEGHLPAGNASFVGLCLLVVAVPLAVQNGRVAALALAAYLALALLSRTTLRRTWLSWLPWAASFAMLPAFLSYGGWGSGEHGGAPTWRITAAVAALGIGVHVLLALPGLVADNKAKVRHLPLRVALRIGARPLLVLTVLYLIAAVVAIVVVGATVGLRQ